MDHKCHIYTDRVLISLRAMFGIPKRLTSLCLRVLSEIFLLFVGGDMSDNWGVWFVYGVPAVRVTTCVVYQ